MAGVSYTIGPSILFLASPRRLFHSRGPRWRARTYLFLLVFACLGPGIVGGAAFFIHESREGRHQLEADTLHTARALAHAVDNYVLRTQSLAEGLASADSLARGDFAAFNDQARRTLKQSSIGTAVVLSDPAGQIILHTLKDYGEPLPRHGNPAIIRQVAESGQPAISDLYIGNVLNRPMVTAAVPVNVGGRVAYVLNVPIAVERLVDVLLSQDQPSGRFVSISDSTGTIVARTRDGEKYIGHKVVPEYMDRLLAADEGAVETHSVNGIPVLAVFTRAPVTGWRISIATPLEAVDSQVGYPVMLLAGGVLVLLGIGLGLAWLVGGRIAHSFHALVEPAAALGEGNPLRLEPVPVKEAAEVGKALEEAQCLLLERGRALDVAAQTLRTSEEKYRTLFSNMTEGFALGEPVFDHHGVPVDFRWIEANEAFYRQTGLHHGILGVPARQMLPRLEHDWVDAFGQVAMNGQSVRFENFNFDTQRHYDVYAFCPAPGRFAVLFRDITARKAAEKALVESRTTLARVMDLVPMVIYIYEAESDRTIYVNRAVETATGYRPEEVLAFGASFARELVHPDDRALVDQVVGGWQQVASGDLVEFECRIRSREGLWRHVTSREVAIVRDGEGRAQQVLGVAMDVSLRVWQRLVQDQKLADFARMGRLLSMGEMASALAHELTQPLTAISNFTQACATLLKKGKIDPEELKRALEQTSSQALRAGRTLQAVRDFLRKREPRPGAMAMNEVVREVVGLSQIRSRPRPVDYRLDLHPDLPEIWADRILVEQVLLNLVRNAEEATDGEAQAVVEISTRLDGEDFAVIAVRDFGCGLPEGFDLDRLPAFYTTKADGMGVGLGICRSIVEASRGRIWAESAPGGGSVFRFCLPLAPVAETV